MESNGKGLAIASMVLGIVSLVLNFFGLGFITIITAIVGLVLGIVAKKKGATGMATAGVVMSIIALAIIAITFLACAACAGAVGDSLNDVVQNGTFTIN